MSDAWLLVLRIAFVLVAVLNLAALLTWLERKQSALMQDRIGANRATVLGFRAMGLFHIVADSLKMFLKEDFVPRWGSRFFHTLAPFVSAFCALAVFACIPFGDVLRVGGSAIPLQIAEADVALLMVFAFLSLGVYGVFFAGWASRNKFGLLGALRGCAQMLSYEVCLGVSIVGLVMVYGTLSLREMALWQGRLLFGFLPAWGVFLQPVAFFVFFTAGMAETKRVPFDLPEGESEIIGYFVEYSSMKFGLFFLTDFIEIVIVACLSAHFFFGGWQVPYLQDSGFLFPWGSAWPLPFWLTDVLRVAAFGFKVFFLCWLQLAVRWTLPRFRYDQLMDLGWKILLPVSIANVLVTGAVILLVA